MNSNNCLRSLSIVLSFLLMIHSSFCQPNAKDYYKVAAELGCFLYLQYGFNMDPPKNNSSSGPNKFDQFFRNKLRWNKNMDFAKDISDFLLYGVFVGGIPFSPLMSNKNYNDFILTNIEVLSLNGILTNVVKHTVKRQRPYSFYNIKTDNNDSYKSFYSGHTSTAFAIGTSTAIELSKSEKYNNKIIWSSILGLAGFTGYFRIAADKHYMTDVLTGAISGILIGYHVQNYRNKKNNKFQMRFYNHRLNLIYSL